MPKQSTGVPGLSWVFKYGETSGTIEIYTAIFKSTLSCARELLIFSSCILLCFCFFLSSVSCHFLGYQFVLFHFQFTASNLLSAPGKRDNWASYRTTQRALWGLLHISQFLCFYPLAGSTRNSYNWRTCTFWTGSIFLYYVQIKEDNNLSQLHGGRTTSGILFAVKSNNYNARGSDTSWWGNLEVMLY